MSVRLLALTIATPRPREVSTFWARLLDRDAVDDLDGVLVPGSDTQIGLRFVEDPRPVTHPTRVHLHVTSDHAVSQDAVVAQALALGAVHRDVGQQPDEGHVVLADPDDTPFCVIEQGSSFLAGTGVLGELACDGTRAVGLFWSAALDWPLVWDRDEETAIQSAAGGTKIAWGGPPVHPHDGRSRQRLELVSDDLDADVELLISLGAAPLGTDGPGVALADPDGNELRVRAG